MWNRLKKLKQIETSGNQLETSWKTSWKKVGKKSKVKSRKLLVEKKGKNRFKRRIS